MVDRQNSYFLMLPRELRDMIYIAYISEDDGYFYDFHTGKLTAADHRLIDLSLMLTCTQVATEMKGLALGTNLITFSTVYDDNLRDTACQFNHLMGELSGNSVWMLKRGREHITTELLNEVEIAHPQFKPELDQIRDGGIDDGLGVVNGWGGVESLRIDFVRTMLRLISVQKQPVTFLPREIEFLKRSGPRDIFALLSLDCSCWSIPSDLGNQTLAEVLRPIRELWEGYPNRIKYRISAAASAVHFLECLPAQTRLEFRHLCVKEDLPSVAFPECHARGLIPFCQENQKLRIERRVCLWRNAFTKHAPPYLYELADSTLEEQVQRQFPSSYCGVWASRALKDWVMEADHLPLFGMPPQSFTLTLDGSLIPEKSSQIFNIIQGDAAWQYALEESITRGFLPKQTFRERRKNHCYISEDFPRIIWDITAGNSLIRCNFDCGEPYDTEKIIEDYRGRSFEDWEDGWYDRNETEFDTSPELPKWPDLRLEQVLPKV